MATMDQTYNGDGTVTRVFHADDGETYTWTATADESGAITDPDKTDDGTVLVADVYAIEGVG